MTLYCVTSESAIFVEVSRGCDVTSSHASPFYTLAQFENAMNLVIIPIHVFHKMAQSIGPPEGRFIFVGNTTRCGSTLLLQVFEETGSALAFSEPAVLGQLADYRSQLNDADFERLASHVMNMLCKRQKETYVFKLTIPTMALIPHMKRLYPDVHCLFLYRDGLNVAQSLVKIVSVTPYLAFKFHRRVLSFRLKNMYHRLTGREKVKSMQESTLQYSAMLWAYAIKCYLDLRAKGMFWYENG